MKSRKLRALALVLSAIMIITAVPSTMFAEDFVVGEVDGWDDTEITEAEAPAEAADDFGFGFDAEVEEAPFVADEFDFFAADELVGAEDGIKSEEWDADAKTVKITFKSAELAPVTYTVADGLQVIVSSTNCTKSFMKATVKNEKGTEIEIFSNIPTGSRSVTLKFNGETLDVNEDPDNGLFPNGASHKWDAGKRFDEEYGCDEDTFKTEYTCTVCGTKGYKDSLDGTVSDEVEKDNAVEENAKGSGHKKPSDAKAITTVTIYKQDDFEAIGANVILDAKTGAELTKDDVKIDNIKFDSKGNAVLDSNKEPVAATEGQDVFWIICTYYECANDCGKIIAEVEQKDKIVRSVVYGLKANANVTCTLDEDTSEAATALKKLGYEKIYVGSGDYAKDKDFFTIASCYDDKGLATTGKYDELWYTSETLKDEDNPIAAKYEHTINAHEKTKTVFVKKAVTVGKQKEDAAAIVTDVEGICRVSKKDGEVVSVDGSKSCQDVTYYEVVLCDCANADQGKTVISCTSKVAAGDDEAHKLNVDISALIENNTPINIKDKAIDENIYTFLDRLKDKTSVSVKNATYTCTENGTVDVYYTCAVCGKDVLLGTFKVEAPGHKWEWVDIDPKKEATCTAEGYVTQQSQCTVCGVANPDLAVRKAITPKLNHAGVEDDTKVKEYFLSVADDGDIVGVQTVNAGLKDIVEEANQKYENTKVVNARVYKICPICGKPVYKDPTNASAEANWGVTPTLTVKSITSKNFRCNNGTIVIEATAKDPNDKEITPVSGTYDYWKNINSYQARTAHTAVVKDDGSVVCAVCGDVLTDAPVVTTVAPTTVEPTTVVTTEAPTTVAPTTAAPTTEAPTTTAPTTEAPVVPTTVAPVTVEPTTEITTVEPATMPAQVTGEKVTKNSPANGIIGVKYNAVEGADSYTVNVREPNGAWTKNPTNGAETAYDITGLTEGKLYDIRIAAVAAGIAGPRSGHLYRWLKKVTLMKPTKIKDEAGAVNVTWDAADGATKYKLYVSSDKTFKTGVQKIKVVENTAKVTGLQAGTKYYFKVRCYTKGADGKTYTGGWSNVKSKTLK